VGFCGHSNGYGGFMCRSSIFVNERWEGTLLGHSIVHCAFSNFGFGA
jgi:hypothetical protein